MQHDSMQFHNIVELREIEGNDGKIFQRIPEDVRGGLNKGAQANYRRPAGSEIRFIADGTVRIELSCPDTECKVLQFWGPFQGKTVEIAAGRRTIEIEQPEQIAHLRPEVAERFAFSPRLCRLCLPHNSTSVFYHGVEGDVRPPRNDDLPDIRYLAYGTSITRGMAATRAHLTYVNQAARGLGADLVNLGTAGSAFCEEEIADHMARRDDWDIATLALSVNMVAGFAVEEFKKRATYMVETMAKENPEKPIACITLYPYFPDISTEKNGHENHDVFRETLRTIVDETSHDNVHLIEGTDVLDNVGGLTADLTHPGDNGMIEMGDTLATRLEALLS